jgi:alkyldihydroxyacetonephosphate synthase
LFLGSEGTLGIVTGATLRMTPLPDVRAWAVFTFARFADGLDALRLIHRTDARPALVRLLDAPAAAAAAGEMLRAGRDDAGAAAASVLLLLAFEGDELVQTGQYQMAHAVCQKVGGTEQAPEIGEKWFEEQRQQPAGSVALAANARPGGLADIFAVSAPWSRITAVHAAMRSAVSPLVTQLHGQIGHAYATGAALELLFEAQAEPAAPEAARELYARIVASGLEACRGAGGAAIHHYGVGIARREQMAAELGENGLLLLRRLKTALDPQNVLNPGKLNIGREQP